MQSHTVNPSGHKNVCPNYKQKRESSEKAVGPPVMLQICFGIFSGREQKKSCYKDQKGKANKKSIHSE